MKKTVAEPIIEKIDDNVNALDQFGTAMTSTGGKTRKILLDFPTVYIHNWKDSDDYEVYVGESNDIIKRTKQHYDAAIDSRNWQHELIEKKAVLYIIGHEHFNKSMTLDIENRLMHYIMSVDKVKHVCNLRNNPQTSYYPVEELDDIFRKIWNRLRRDNKELFPSEAEIKDSAIYKASPLHKLTKEQVKARDLIIEKVHEAMKYNEKNQLIFVEGEAGTGKTVLNSSTFYELYCQAEEPGNRTDDSDDLADNHAKRGIRCSLIVNHDEQLTVYEQIADKLGLTEKYGEVVCKPTRFINLHTPDDPIDVAFVDEAHLLLTQGKQSYRGNNQLKDIIDRARVTVVMFDENQILTTEQYWEAKSLEKYRNMAKKVNNYIVLDEQLRMRADKATNDWIDSFTKQGVLKKIPKPAGGYSIRIFDDPWLMEDEIKKRAESADTSLSRLIATYDWDYSSKRRPDKRLEEYYWCVCIKKKNKKWTKPWNRELVQELNKEEKKETKKLSWAEQKKTVEEVGSTFTIQGFDLNYAGVILGPSVKYRNGRIIYDPSESRNEKATRYRTLSDGTKQKFGESLVKHEVRVLMTRGVNGMYIYACDDELREALKKATM
ncbi:MAG: DNA/RNA helicase domain-containing protein [Lachnospiraceae bacterium]